MRPFGAGILKPQTDEASEAFRSGQKWYNNNNSNKQSYLEENTVSTMSFDSDESEVLISFDGGDDEVTYLRGEEPRLLNLFA